MADAATAQAAGLVAAHTTRFLRNAEWAARLGPQLVAQRRLDPGDFDAIEALRARRAPRAPGAARG